MRIGLFTLVAGQEYHEWVLPGLRTKREYCGRHGYDDLEVVDHALVQGAELPLSWYKLSLLSDILRNQTHEVVFCSDADVCITNPAIRLEAIIQKYLPPAKDLLFCRQSVWAARINAGNFFIRNTAWSRRFLETWFQQGKRYESAKPGFWEQDYINEVCNSAGEIPDHIEVIGNQRAFNSFHLNWAAGDFLIHFPTLRRETLKKAMHKWGDSTFHPE